jgi:FlaA1/EpsC-like NDP-sugar epimerase
MSAVLSVRPAGLKSHLSRSVGLIVLDGLAWGVGLTLATVARHEFSASTIDWFGLAAVIGLVVAGQFVVGTLSGLYTGRTRFASFEQAGVLAAGAAVLGGGLFVGLAWTPGARPVPLGASVAGTAMFTVIALGTRYLWRMANDHNDISRHRRTHRAIVFGTGDGGYAAALALLKDPLSDVLPVVFLDDDPRRRNLRLLGCDVAGGRQDIAEVAARCEADTMVIAMPSASRGDVSAVARRARLAGLQVRILPRTAQYLETVGIGHIRPLSFSDLLGRDEARLDLGSIAQYLQGRRVLVTGAGGSIGSQLCATIARFEPERLIKLDRDENALHRLQLRLEGRALLDSDSLVVADIRDPDAMDHVMELHRPHVVFHAAALKHVTFLERFPDEAVKTNVFGTLNALRAAVSSKVERFINVSTDKAADPVSVLGLTKRVGEALTHAVCADTATVGISVRFGNVLGSQGSVITTLSRQIAEGDPLTITDPAVSRYFMTIEEAVQLVVQAGAVGRTGEVMVLDMGEPVLIVDLARELAAEIDPGVDITIEYTGLRPGEKLHEVLVGAGEHLLRRPHELIACYAAPRLRPAAVESLRGARYVEFRGRLETLAEVNGVVTPLRRRSRAITAPATEVRRTS